MLQGPTWTTDIERENAARNSRQKLNEYFQPNRIYYSEAVCNAVDAILQLSWDIIVDMSVAKMTSETATSGHERALALKEWRNNDNRVSTEITQARRNLEKEFKKILGSE